MIVIIFSFPFVLELGSSRRGIEITLPQKAMPSMRQSEGYVPELRKSSFGACTEEDFMQVRHEYRGRLRGMGYLRSGNVVHPTVRT